MSQMSLFQVEYKEVLGGFLNVYPTISCSKSIKYFAFNLTMEPEKGPKDEKTMGKRGRCV